MNALPPKKKFKILIPFIYFILSFALLLFSFTQVDLGLTLSHASVIQSIQKSFQQIGFYQRPIATVLFLIVLFLFFVGYLVMLQLARKKILTERDVWITSVVIGIVLFFSYSAAFSYDIFNYIFTAKTVLIYHLNPYVIKPLQLNGIDSMLSFMRWTHLPSAYTPFWIFLTLPEYLLSFGSLLLAMWTMKIVPILSYFLTIWCISHIMTYYEKSSKTVSLVAFALNPLVVIEVLVSGHNDIVMMSLGLLGFLLFLQKNKLSSFLLYSLSVGLKFITIFQLPLFLFGWNRVKALVLISLGLLIVLVRREFLAWYFLWVIPYASLFPNNKLLINIMSGITVGLLLRYAPVLYTGTYDQNVPLMQSLLFGISIAVSVCFSVIQYLLPRKAIR